MFFDGTVSFQAVIQNPTSASVAISTRPFPYIFIATITKDGTPIEPSSIGPVSSVTASPVSLATIAPQGSVSFTIPGVYYQIFRKQPKTSVMYSPSGTGNYSVTFGYQYYGGDAGIANVYHGVLLSNPVTFTVN
jgi:hypothetical protein